MESLDSGHTTVKTENSQPGLSQGQDPSSRVLLRSTRVATVACDCQWRVRPTPTVTGVSLTLPRRPASASHGAPHLTEAVKAGQGPRVPGPETPNLISRLVPEGIWQSTLSLPFQEHFKYELQPHA